MIKAVVFDVGETLIDETRIWCRWADRLGVPRFAMLGVIGGMAATGRPLADAFEVLSPGIDLEEEQIAWAAEEPDSLRVNFDADDLYPDVRRALAKLRARGLRVIIAGNQPPQAKAALEAMDLPVDAVYTSAEWALEKPDPKFFDKVVEVTELRPPEICYVGDRVDNDVMPANAAGMVPVLIRRGPWGYLHAELPQATRYGVVVDGLDALPDLLAPTDR
ncbi:Phosphatase yihX [Nocardia otitidiscaviarum]|uniref:Phosphatase yihX n=1 Tax=Nocardia otitidiscaviarum TaxID=1823 RepID=A0A379JGA0_9NOCA|nr:HAD family hydrolase [Nocardia otitidiscaviarum]SUD47669.1 Phosphatase yihX [Nocardia otitidiscaviarum]